MRPVNPLDGFTDAELWRVYVLLVAIGGQSVIVREMDPRDLGDGDDNSRPLRFNRHLAVLE